MVLLVFEKTNALKYVKKIGVETNGIRTRIPLLLNK